ncbi:MAG: hypothetical protein IJ578_05935 [Bacteroidales bacterium]|nr:hypothetical protein [Bacteroidales bacterium]
MPFQRIALRTMPDGSSRLLYPFHISLEGLEDVVLCRDDEDYDVMVKHIFVCALRKKVRVVDYIVMSNHAHIVILAVNRETANDFSIEIKRIYSQYFFNKYKQRKILLRTGIHIQYLDSDWYLRNALAYIPRNALDALSKIENYRWTGYRGMFCGGKISGPVTRVCMLTRREKEALFHTHEDLSQVSWLLNCRGELEPASACDYTYLENAFLNDPAFYLRTLGGVNRAEMEQLLEENMRTRQKDAEFLKSVDAICHRWFQKGIQEVSLEMKIRILPYIYRTRKTSVPQIARCFGMERRHICKILGLGKEL